MKKEKLEKFIKENFSLIISVFKQNYYNVLLNKIKYPKGYKIIIYIDDYKIFITDPMEQQEKVFNISNGVAFEVGIILNYPLNDEEVFQNVKLNNSESKEDYKKIIVDNYFNNYALPLFKRNLEDNISWFIEK